MPTYFFVNPGNANLSWSLASSWATSSGGNAGTLSFPTASDDVLFDANSGTGTCSINSANLSCSSLDFTGYSGTINFVARSLTLTSSAIPAANAKLVLSPTMTITGSGAIAATPATQFLNIRGSYQITSSGKIWNDVPIVLGNTPFNTPVTTSLADNLHINANFRADVVSQLITSSVSVVTMSFERDVNSNGSCDILGICFPIASNRLAFQFTGSRNQSIGLGNGNWRGTTLIINKSPTSVCIVPGVTYQMLEVDYKSGILSSSASPYQPFILSGFNTTAATFTHSISTNGNIVGTTGSAVNFNMGKLGSRVILQDDLKFFSGSLIGFNRFGTATQIIDGPGKLYLGDGTHLASRVTMSLSTGTPTLSGSAEMRIEGAGTINIFGASAANTAIAIPLTINTTGTVNFVEGSFYYGYSSVTDFTQPVLTYTAGTVSSTTLVPANCTLQTNGMTWNIVQPSNTIRLTNNLQATTIQVSANTTFTGSAGFTASNYTQTTAGTTTTFQNGNSYLVTNALTGVGTLASPVVFRASTLNTPRAIFTHQNGGSQTMIYVSGNFIDSSQGQTIWTVGTILNNTINWNVGVKRADRSSTFVN